VIPIISTLDHEVSPHEQRIAGSESDKMVNYSTLHVNLSGQFMISLKKISLGTFVSGQYTIIMDIELLQPYPRMLKSVIGEMYGLPLICTLINSIRFEQTLHLQKAAQFEDSISELKYLHEQIKSIESKKKGKKKKKKKIPNGQIIDREFVEEIISTKTIINQENDKKVEPEKVIESINQEKKVIEPPKTINDICCGCNSKLSEEQKSCAYFITGKWYCGTRCLPPFLSPQQPPPQPENFPYQSPQPQQQEIFPYQSLLVQPNYFQTPALYNPYIYNPYLMCNNSFY